MKEYIKKMDYNLTISLKESFLNNINGFYDLT